MNVKQFGRRKLIAAVAIPGLLVALALGGADTALAGSQTISAVSNGQTVSITGSGYTWGGTVGVVEFYIDARGAGEEYNSWTTQATVGWLNCGIFGVCVPVPGGQISLSVPALPCKPLVPLGLDQNKVVFIAYDFSTQTWSPYTNWQWVCEEK